MTRKGMHNNTVDIDVHIHHETEKAYLISTDGKRDNAEWVPKSQVEMERRGRVYSVTMSEELAMEKGLI